jgi:hypothetical protein
MLITFEASDELPPTVVAVLAQHPDRTVVLLNYTLVELMSPQERMELLNALFARMDEPPTGGRSRGLDELDELAAPRRERSRRAHDNHRHGHPGPPRHHESGIWTSSRPTSQMSAVSRSR